MTSATTSAILPPVSWIAGSWTPANPAAIAERGIITASACARPADEGEKAGINSNCVHAPEYEHIPYEKNVLAYFMQRARGGNR